MEIGNTLFTSQLNRSDAAGGDRPGWHPDWPTLQARYTAAHAIRRELLVGLADRSRSGGSFDRIAATALQGGSDNQRGVNPVDLVDGKYPGGKDSVTGGATMTGGRGR